MFRGRDEEKEAEDSGVGEIVEKERKNGVNRRARLVRQ